MRTPIITGHAHFRPVDLPEPLEFDLGPGDAELVARCAEGIDALRRKNAEQSDKSEGGEA